jgi:hypothetical protein
MELLIAGFCSATAVHGSVALPFCRSAPALCDCSDDRLVSTHRARLPWGRCALPAVQEASWPAMQFRRSQP